MKTTYRLGSSNFVFTPGLIAWAINAAHFKKDRQQIVDLIAEGWGVPPGDALALLTKKVPFKIENDAVVFSVESK